MKKFSLLFFVALFAFGTSTSAFARDKRVTLTIEGQGYDKAGIIPLFRLDGTPHALIIAREKAEKNFKDDAEKQCGELKGKLKWDFFSRYPKIDCRNRGKEFFCSTKTAIDCMVPVPAEADPAVADATASKPKEIVIDGKVYVEKTDDASGAPSAQ